MKRDAAPAWMGDDLNDDTVVFLCQICRAMGPACCNRPGCLTSTIHTWKKDNAHGR